MATLLLWDRGVQKTCVKKYTDHQDKTREKYRDGSHYHRGNEENHRNPEENERTESPDRGDFTREIIYDQSISRLHPEAKISMRYGIYNRRKLRSRSITHTRLHRRIYKTLRFHTPTQPRTPRPTGATLSSHDDRAWQSLPS